MLYLEIAIVVVVGGFALLFILTVLLEKQLIHEYVPRTPEPTDANSPYFIAMNQAAQQLGFAPAGLFAQERGSKIYQARLALWLSPDRQTILRVAGGTTIGVKIRRSILTTLIEPDRIIETSDEYGGPEMSGLSDRVVVMNAHLEELHTRHMERVAAVPGTRRTFSAEAAMAACEEMQAMKAAQMEKLGLGKFLNPQRTIWRHTLKGALLSYFKGFRSQLAQAKAQAHRAQLKRPGDK